MKKVLSKLAGLWRNRHGSAMVEFALGSGVLVLAFAGSFRFGYTFYRYNTLENAVNAGARYASMRPYDSTTSTPSTGYSDAVKNMVVYGQPTAGTNTVAPNLATSNVSITVTFTNGVPAKVAVAITDYSIDSIFASQTLSGKPSVTYPYVGIYSPY